VKKVYEDESNVKAMKPGDKESAGKKLNVYSDGSKTDSVEENKIINVDNQFALGNKSSQILPTDTSSRDVEGCSNFGTCAGRCGLSNSICSCEHNCGGTVECCCDRDIVCKLSPAGMVEDNVVSSTSNESFSEVSSLKGKQCVDKGSCAGRCGGGSASDCWCDEMCDSSGDCCCDREYQCQLVQTGWEDKEKKLSTELFNRSSTSTLNSKTIENTSVSSTPVLSCRNSGSCSGRCGGGSEDDCWCNEICAEDNSCCCDKDLFCDLTPLGMVSKNRTGVVSPITIPSKQRVVSTDVRCQEGTCFGMCGGMADSGCWCDQLCKDSGDCCCDRDIVCYNSMEGWVDRGSTTKSSEGEEFQNLVSSTSTSMSSFQALDTSLTTPKVATLSSVIGSKEFGLPCTLSGNCSMADTGISESSSSKATTENLSRVTVAPSSLLRGNKTVLSPGVPKRCKTIAGPNVNHGCVFPFTYRNKTYTTCPGSTIRGDPWCSTKVDSRQRFVPGYWGFCGRNCPSATKQSPSIQFQTEQASNIRKPILTSRDFVPDGFDTTSQQVKGAGSSSEVNVQENSSKVIKKTEEVNSELNANSQVQAKENSEVMVLNKTSITGISESDSKPKPLSETLNSTMISSAEEDSVSGLDEIAEMLNPRIGNFLQGDRGVANVTVDANVTISEVISPVSSQASLPSLADVTAESNVTTPDYLPAVSTQSSRSPLANVTVETNITTSENLPPVAAQLSSPSLVHTAVDANVTTSEDLPPVSAQSSSPSLANVSAEINDTTSEDPTPVSVQSASPSLVFVSSENEKVPYVKLRPKKTQCLTWAGPEKGERCVFPFTYRNKTFNGCTQFWRQKSWWCATEVDSKGHLEGAKWGLCQDDCPRQVDGADDSVNIDVESSETSRGFDTLGKPIVEDALSLGNQWVEDSLPQPAVREECLTVSGVDIGKTCQFPFIYHGKTYHGCTYNFGVDKPWCSTETEESGNYIPGRWGYCSENCPAHTNHINECITVAGPRPLKLCVFPFMSEGVLHWGCTEKAGKFWCPTLVDDHVEVFGDNWGWCKERCKEIKLEDPCLNGTSTELVEGEVKITTVQTSLTSSSSPKVSIPFSNETSGALVSEEEHKSTKSSTTVSVDPGHVTSPFQTLKNRTAPLRVTVDQSANITSDLTVVKGENVALIPDQLALSPQPVCSNRSSCSGRCGGGSDDDCWCDDLCVQSGDCCCDREKVCGDVQITNGTGPQIVGNNRNSSTMQSDAFETPKDVNPLVTSTSESTTFRSNTSALNAVRPIQSANASDVGPNVLDSLQTDDPTRIGNVSTFEPFSTLSIMSSSTVTIPNSQSPVTDESLLNMENTTSSTSINMTSTSEALSLKTSSALPPDLETTPTQASISSSPSETLSENVTKSISLDNGLSTITSTLASFNMSVLSRSHYRGCLHSGSCESMCGGGSDYTCWCDAECAKNDDCCCDMDTYCVAHPGSEDTQDSSLQDSAPTRPPKLCKAGTCSGRCGGGSDQDCWCDEHCALHHYADCCCDVDTVCTFENVQPHVSHNTTACSNSGSCSGRCDGGSDKDCWCDDLCVQSGDCCCDKEEVCATDLVSSTEGSTVSTTKVQSTSKSTEYVLSTDGSIEDACTSGCMTDSSGPRQNSCCLFPFIYNGEEHNTCIEVDGDKAWCSTKLDEGGLFISNEWGYCDKKCVFNTPSPYSMSEGYNTSTVGVGSIKTTSTSSQSRKPSQGTLTPTTLKSSEAAASSSSTESTTTSTTISSTKKTTLGTVWAPYVFVFKAKPSPDFLAKLPPAQSVVHIPPTQYDPVRALLGDLI